MKHGWKAFIEHYKSREHWYIKYITWGIIGIICFAILIQILKEVSFLPAQKIFDFLSQWALVLSAGAMFLLAGTAFWAIIDNRHSRIQDSRRRSLDEIRAWAQDAFQVLSPPGKYLLVDSATLRNMEVSLRSIAARSISAITDANEFGSKLKENVDKAATNLDSFIEKIWSKQGKWVDFNTEWENLKNNFLDVIGIASELRAKITLERF